MIRIGAVAAALLLVTAGNVQGQAAEFAGWGGFRITPYLGYLPSVTRTENRVIESAGITQPYRARFELGRGYGAGLQLDVPVAGPIFILASAGYKWREESQEYSELEAGTRTEAGSHNVLVRAGLSLRTGEPSPLQVRRISLGLFGGAAMVREMPRPDAYRTAARPMNLPGATLGLDVELPLGRRAALILGAESLVVWWPDEELGRRNDSVYASAGVQTLTTVYSRPTSIWVIRGGLAFAP
jgi:hypothetical protein